MYYGELTPYQTSWDGKWGFVDEDDNFVIQPIYDEVDEFEGYFASVVLRGRYGYIDREGNWYDERPR